MSCRSGSRRLPLLLRWVMTKMHKIDTYRVLCTCVVYCLILRVVVEAIWRLLVVIRFVSVQAMDGYYICYWW